MERLTDYHFDGSGAYMVCSGACIDDKIDCNCCTKLEEIVERLAAYEDTISLERAKEFAQAEKDGRLMVLPVKEGSKIYRVRFNFEGDYLEIIEIDFDLARFRPEDFGRIVFLTREEAEAALKKREV